MSKLSPVNRPSSSVIRETLQPEAIVESDVQETKKNPSFLTKAIVATATAVGIAGVGYVAGRASVQTRAASPKRTDPTFIRAVHEYQEMGFNHDKLSSAAGKGSGALTDAEAVACAVYGAKVIGDTDLKDQPAAVFLSEKDVKSLAKKKTNEGAEDHEARLKDVADKARMFKANFPAATDVLATTMVNATKRNESAPKL